MQPNSNPSAPPEDADDFEFVEDSMKNQNNNIHHSQPQGYIQPNDMAIPDAITQQLIYQRIMAEKQKKEEKTEEKEEKKEYKQQPQPQQAQPGPGNGPKPSFMSQDIPYPESSLYKTAGIAVWRPKENGKGIQFMMGLEKTSNSFSFFGGQRDNNDKTCVDTAMREFHEETGKKLDDDTLSQIRSMLIRDGDRCVFWKQEWKSVLYYYQMSYDYNIVTDYKNMKKWNAEIKSIHWIDFEKIFQSVFITGNPIKLSKNIKYPLRSFVVGMMLHAENKKYLFDLHTKYGGNKNILKALKGGNIRNTVALFTNIPKVIRLDILSPITHSVLYNKWIESDINEIEDYQLLISLIASICPEMGRNFRLCFTENKSFKSSKSQFVIDTIPSFGNLQKKLANNKNFVTKINILPTFIVSDNFKDISLSFKKNQVSWKDIHCGNDDEKGFGASVYNKASQFAQAWFGDDKDDSDDGDGGNLWKWQFMNDNNKFEDFKCKNSKLLETSFMSGCSFTNFKRNLVYYQANFQTMCQKNLNTKNIRAIRRVPGSVAGDKAKKVLQYYKWQYQQDNGIWTDYEVAMSKKLNTFKVNYDNGYQYNWYGKYDNQCTYSASIKNNNYLIDIEHLKQQNVSTKKERSVRQIPVYDDNNKINNYFNNNNNNNGVFNNFYQYKWQFKEDGYNIINWKDFDMSVSQFIENQYTLNSFCLPFTVNTNKKNYKIHFKTMQQQCLLSGKFRSIRRQQINFANNVNGNSPIKHGWEWLDDDNQYKKYDKYTSNQIENACNSGIKKYFFVSKKNNNSYEIDFRQMSQHNVQSGMQRKVRKTRLEPEWKGVGPNPRKWNGPILNNNKRKTFGKKVVDLYCIVGDTVAAEVKKCGKLIRGSLGPFGCGIYVYDNASMAKEMAKNRSKSNKGNIIVAKVFVGMEFDVSNMDDKEYDFISLQKNGCDSISRSLGFGKEYILYNMDQICIVKVDKNKN